MNEAGTSPEVRSPNAGGEARLELMPGVALVVRRVPGGAVHIGLEVDDPVREVRLDLPGLVLCARGAIRLTGGSVEVDSERHLDLRAGGQVRLWGDDVVEDDR